MKMFTRIFEKNINDLIDNFKKQLPEVFYEKSVFKNFAIFSGKKLCWSLFLIKLEVFQQRCFHVNIAKYLRILTLKNICKLLLNLVSVHKKNKWFDLINFFYKLIMPYIMQLHKYFEKMCPG